MRPWEQATPSTGAIIFGGVVGLVLVYLALGALADWRPPSNGGSSTAAPPVQRLPVPVQPYSPEAQRPVLRPNPAATAPRLPESPRDAGRPPREYLGQDLSGRPTYHDPRTGARTSVAPDLGGRLSVTVDGQRYAVGQDLGGKLYIQR